MVSFVTASHWILPVVPLRSA